MKKISTFLLNFMIFGALAILISAFIFALIIVKQQGENSLVLDYLSLLVGAIGVVALVLNLLYAKKAYLLYISLFIIVWGPFIFLLDQGVVPYSLYQWWPLIGVTCGVLIFITGWYKYKKMKLGYAIPALTLTLMGVWFMLFSFKIIKVSFRVVAAVGGPLFVILVCVFLFAFFLMQQRYKNLVIKDEGPSAFEDDDIIAD